MQLAQRQRSEGVGHLPGDVLQYLAPEFVAPERAGCAGEADVGQMPKKRLDGSRGSSRRFAHRRFDPDHALRDVSTIKDVLHRLVHGAHRLWWTAVGANS